MTEPMDRPGGAADDPALDAEGDLLFLPPEGTVGRRLYRLAAAGDREAAGVACDHFDLAAGMPVPPARLRLCERLAAALGVDAEALLREVEETIAGR